MPSARINGTTITQLDGRRAPARILIEDDVKDTAKLSKELTSIVNDAAELQRRHNPRRIDFEDQLCTSANTLELHHGFGGKVRWWVVDWTGSGTPLVDSGGDVLSIKSPMLVRNVTKTDSNTLYLDSYVAGTVTIRIEEAG